MGLAGEGIGGIWTRCKIRHEQYEMETKFWVVVERAERVERTGARIKPTRGCLYLCLGFRACYYSTCIEAVSDLNGSKSLPSTSTSTDSRQEQ